MRPRPVAWQPAAEHVLVGGQVGVEPGIELVKAWHTDLNDPTLADPALDRIVPSSHKIALKGTRSMRDGDAAGAP